jgi:hypothetical protein
MKEKEVAQTPEIWGIDSRNLERILRDYDNEMNGWYREDPYQGYAVYKHLRKVLFGEELQGDKFDEVAP